MCPLILVHAKTSYGMHTIKYVYIKFILQCSTSNEIYTTENVHFIVCTKPKEMMAKKLIYSLICKLN